MPRHRLFIAHPIAQDRDLEIEGDALHYLNRVLRLKTGAEITVFEGDGYEYPAVITELGKYKAVLRPGERRSRDTESALPIRLVQGVSRGERMDMVMQKATELGVHTIIPVITEFTVVRLQPERAHKRVEHWRRIARSACEQCRRNRLPEIAEPLTLAEYLQSTSDVDRRLLLDPRSPTPLGSLAGDAGAVELLLGPEGGLSPAEKAAALATGFTAVSMGPRILRSETAALTAVVLVQARWGDLQA